MNYAAMSVLQGLLTPTSRVFEYGSGGSSLWLSELAGEVHVVEHDRGWAETVRAMSGSEHLNLRYVPCKGDATEAPGDDEYVAAVTVAGDGDGFDVVIVDGVARCACLRAARRWLRPGGVLVLDDSERPAYADARAELIADGAFRELMVTGVKPTYSFMSATSFFVPLA